MVRTGYYHENNVLNFRILEAASNLPSETFTTRGIEAATGIDFKTVGGALGHYHKVGIGYFRRMQKKGCGNLVIHIAGSLRKRELTLMKLTYCE